MGVDDIVITGIGCVTPIGIGREAFWNGLASGHCATRELFRFSTGDRALFGAPIDDFDGKDYVSPRKALKVMGREVQLSYAAAQLAWEDAGLTERSIEPERIGVVFGSEPFASDLSELLEAIRDCSDGPNFDPTRWGTKFGSTIFPLWMLRYLPNMPPCHIAIAVDARGPNNTIAQEEVSGLLALGEAVRIMDRGDADVMIVGALGARVGPTRLAYRMPGLYLESANAVGSKEFHSRAFDAHSAGIVPGEASVVFILERRRHAVARKAAVHGTLLATSSCFGRPDGHRLGSSKSVESAAKSALESGNVSPSELACISAQGYSHRGLDRTEASGIASLHTETPVTAYSSYVGTAGAASSLVQLAAAVLATSNRKVLPILGFDSPSPDCPIPICRGVQPASQGLVLQLSFTPQGNAAAALVDCS